MRSLTSKLILAFVVVCLTQAVLVTVLQRREVQHQMNTYLYEQNLQAFVADIQGHYAETGSLQDAIDTFQPGRFAGRRAVEQEPRRPRMSGPLPPAQRPERRGSDVRNPAPPRGEQGGRPQRDFYRFGLADTIGTVVLPTAPYARGERVSASVLTSSTPILDEGQRIGYVLASAEPVELGPREMAFLGATSRNLWLATLGALGIAIVVGGVFVFNYMRPLRSLIDATRAMARGEEVQEVPARTKDELGVLTRAFNDMNRNVQRANAARRQMTADIAHDLRTPLSVITGYLEALKDGALPGTPERFTVMHKEAENLTRLVEDLRILSLADAGELPLQPQLLDPAQLLAQVRAAFLQKATADGIVLEANVEPRLPQVNIDEMRMLQALGNLVSNALRFTPNGGRIILSAQAEEEQFVFTVEDTGVGIPADKLPRVFERFYRADVARNDSVGESGLGLAIVKSIVRAHGGTVHVESIEGKGTTFSLRLPRLAEHR